MKKIYITLLAAAAVCAAHAEDSAELITLDLTKATPALTFEANNGMWTGTFDDDETAVTSQCFNFVHSSMSAYQTWWGFTASNSADNSQRTDYITYQYSNMAKGGIVLNEDGTVKKDSFGAVVTSAAVPYMVAYYSPYMGRKPLVMNFAGGASYEPQGVYLNLNSYAYYPIEYGAAPARAFTNGDSLKVEIYGVAADKSEKRLDVPMASYANGNLNINRGWRYVDLTALGSVNEIYFKVSGTDNGPYGLNTPSYFCLDKMTVKKPAAAGIAPVATTASIAYDRATRSLSVAGAEYVAVYDAAGQQVAASEASTLDVSSLPAGIYIAKAGDASLKFAR